MKAWQTGLIAGIVFATSMAVAQLIIQDGSVVTGHLLGAPPPNKTHPTTTSCTLVAGSTDFAGQCAATATSGVVITFGEAYNTVPFCVFTDSTTPADSAATYTKTAISWGTTVSADKLNWICVGQTGN